MRTASLPPLPPAPAAPRTLAKPGGREGAQGAGRAGPAPKRARTAVSGDDQPSMDVLPSFLAMSRNKGPVSSAAAAAAAASLKAIAVPPPPPRGNLPRSDSVSSCSSSSSSSASDDIIENQSDGDEDDEPIGSFNAKYRALDEDHHEVRFFCYGDSILGQRTRKLVFKTMNDARCTAEYFNQTGLFGVQRVGKGDFRAFRFEGENKLFRLVPMEGNFKHAVDAAKAFDQAQTVEAYRNFRERVIRKEGKEFKPRGARHIFLMDHLRRVEDVCFLQLHAKALHEARDTLELWLNLCCTTPAKRSAYATMSLLFASLQSAVIIGSRLYEQDEARRVAFYDTVFEVATTIAKNFASTTRDCGRCRLYACLYAKLCLIPSRCDYAVELVSTLVSRPPYPQMPSMHVTAAQVYLARQQLPFRLSENRKSDIVHAAKHLVMALKLDSSHAPALALLQKAKELALGLMDASVLGNLMPIWLKALESSGNESNLAASYAAKAIVALEVQATPDEILRGYCKLAMEGNCSALVAACRLTNSHEQDQVFNLAQAAVFCLSGVPNSKCSVQFSSRSIPDEENINAAWRILAMCVETLSKSEKAAELAKIAREELSRFFAQDVLSTTEALCERDGMRLLVASHIAPEFFERTGKHFKSLVRCFAKNAAAVIDWKRSD